MGKWILVLGLLAALACPAWAPSAHALDADEVNLPQTMDVQGQTLALNGTGLRVAYGIVDVYVAGLYLATKTTNDTQAMAMEGNKYMSMTFVRDVDAEDICDAWDEGMEDNLPEAEYQAMGVRLERLCTATPDIKEGDVMTYEYDAASESTEFKVNGALKVKMPGKDFFQGMLSCWIGPDPGPGKDFKKGVLGIAD